MPKRAKASSSRVEPPPDFDTDRFTSVTAWNWYNNELNKKAIVAERGLKIVEGWDEAVQVIVWDRDWEKFVDDPPLAIENVVKEFYSNIVDARGTTCLVRGKRVPFGAKTINTFYGTPSIADDDWFPFSVQEDVDVDLITKTICIGDVAWEMTRNGAYKHFKVSHLSAEAKVWYAIVMSRIDPGKHSSAVTLDRAKLVYAIMTDMKIDLGKIISSKIKQTATTTATGMWFPSLITALCQQAGVVIGEDEHVMKPLQPIARVSERRFMYGTTNNGVKTRVERTYTQPSPPHGPPGMAYRVSPPPAVHRFNRMTIEDRLDDIRSQQERHETFMKYQFDWQLQMQESMARLSLFQGMPQDELPVFPHLQQGFFPVQQPAREDNDDDMNIEYDQDGWAVYRNDPSNVDSSSGWGPDNMCVHGESSAAGTSSSWGVWPPQPPQQ